MAEDAVGVVSAYFDAWMARDFVRLQSVLADDVSFVGPLGTADGAEECREGIEHLAEITTDIVIVKQFVDGGDVLTWFDLHTTVAPPEPVANWSHVEDGRITGIRVTFDARPLT
jgi:hypothetical protein